MKALRSLAARSNHLTYDTASGTVRKMTKAEAAAATASAVKRTVKSATFSTSG